MPASPTEVKPGPVRRRNAHNGLVPPARARELALVDVAGHALALGPGDGWVRRLDPLRTLVLELCDGEAPVEQLADELATATGAERRRVEESLRATLSGLAAEGLVVDGPPPPPGAPAQHGRRVAPGCT
jgi:hypothetical protein